MDEPHLAPPLEPSSPPGEPASLVFQSQKKIVQLLDRDASDGQRLDGARVVTHVVVRCRDVTRWA